MNRFVDTHCHLNFDVFENDLDAVLARASENGIFRIIVPGFDIPSSQKAVELADKNNSIFAAIGVHPNSINSWDESSMDQLRQMAENPKVIAIGEIGLDLYRNPDSFADQVEMLRSQLNLAENCHLPVLLHNRKSSQKLLEIVREYNVRGVFHAFEGDNDLLDYGLNHGFWFGIGGALTYKSSLINREILERYWQLGVLETDSPFLSPLPFRGQRNEPTRIIQIAEYSATMLNISVEELAITTTNNVKTLFGWTANIS